jgi:regulator of sigma E protease
MPAEVVHSILSNAWTAVLVVLVFGGSIFVHELGHFLAARRRGILVERFSIGLGPPIWSHRGKDGVEYRVSWIPVGGYVLLPQLADLGVLEGSSHAEPSKLPPVAYFSKLIVFVAGAAFNVLFAFVIACVIWAVGQPEANDSSSTRIGYVSRTLDVPGGGTVPGPAAAAGVRPGDIIRSIDGQSISTWSDVQSLIQLGSGRSRSGDPQISLGLEREGRLLTLAVYPRLAGEDGTRLIGIAHSTDLLVFSVAPGSRAAAAGFRPGDRILRLDGVPMLSVDSLADSLGVSRASPTPVRVLREGREVALEIAPHPAAKPGTDFGLDFTVAFHTTHRSPFAQLGEQFTMIFRTLGSLINPHSDIGLSKLSSAVGIVHYIHDAAEVGLPMVLMLTVLLNVNLAVLNLLPIPVLDGGQILFATIARIRGRSLPGNFIMTAQGVFVVLILGVMLYVSVFDVRRWVRDSAVERVVAGEK